LRKSDEATYPRKEKKMRSVESTGEICADILRKSGQVTYSRKLSQATHSGKMRQQTRSKNIPKKNTPGNIFEKIRARLSGEGT
jgi:hypothetical protein